MMICCFELDRTRYGFDITTVREVNRALVIDPIPHAPKHVRGYLNIRGQIHLIVDLRVLMGLPSGPLSADSRVIVFTSCVEQSFGVLVDRLHGIQAVDEERIEWRDLSTHAQTKGPASAAGLIAGECVLNSGLIMVVDPKQIVFQT